MYNDYILIDGSYFLFSIFFTTKNEYMFKYSEWDQPDQYDWSTNPEFWTMYQAKFYQILTRIKRRFSVKYSHILFIREGKRDMIWRNSVYTEYKANRSMVIHHKGKDNLLGDLFPRVYYELLPVCEQMYGVKTLRILTAEADDVIFITARYIEAILHQKVVIISKDHDFIQMISPLISVCSIYMDNIMNRVTLTPVQYIMYKLLMGDHSDNIPGSIEASDYNEEELRSGQLFGRLMTENKINMKQFELNKRLILFPYIPYQIKMAIHEQIQLNL